MPCVACNNDSARRSTPLNANLPGDGVLPLEIHRTMSENVDIVLETDDLPTWAVGRIARETVAAAATGALHRGCHSLLSVDGGRRRA
jgi:hypothetical protein